jgi:photosystem II stability/assembly factor-like uncharacterized protein
MQTRLFFSLTAILFISSFCFSQQHKLPEVQLLSSGTNTSLRGLSVVTENVVWVSGSNGTVGKTSNGGKNWKWITVKGFEKKDFRDIEAFDASTAVIMAVDSPAYILRTVDGGDTWKVVYENKTKGMFLDAMEFWNIQSGIVIGDPIDGRFFISRSFDGGATWKDIPFDKRPLADSGEACFAASGTNIRPLDLDEAVFISGGLKSRLFKRDESIAIPILQGTESSGANSIAVWDNYRKNGGKRMIVVGGDFYKPADTNKNCFITTDGGKSWESPVVPPHGYRSCVEYINKTDLVSCGLNGVDYSTDNGKKWDWISKESFNACRLAKMSGNAVYFAGNNGKVAKLIIY